VKLLAFETSSRQGSVALQVEGNVTEELMQSPKQQMVDLLPLVKKLLNTENRALTDLDGITFGRGPGSFTGLRIAAAVAQGLSLASEIPLFPVSSLATIAQGMWRSHRVINALVCVDAYMGEVFWGKFCIQDGLASAASKECLSTPEAVASKGLESWSVVGNGFLCYEAVLGALIAKAESTHVGAYPCARDLFPQAMADLAEGLGQHPEAAMPVYLRSEEAWKR
jgi:tRNA threonylcarbamoyladenosine biosynthesis protein TsaB